MTDRSKDNGHDVVFSSLVQQYLSIVVIKFPKDDADHAACLEDEEARQVADELIHLLREQIQEQTGSPSDYSWEFLRTRRLGDTQVEVIYALRLPDLPDRRDPGWYIHITEQDNT
jgi:hypothetical protein